MILWRFGPKRLSPSLVVWQVRHALLNVSCPDSVSASAPLRAGSWGTAENSRSIRNVMHTNPEITVRGIRPPGIERVVATIRSREPGEMLLRVGIRRASVSARRDGVAAHPLCRGRLLPSASLAL